MRGGSGRLDVGQQRQHLRAAALAAPSAVCISTHLVDLRGRCACSGLSAVIGSWKIIAIRRAAMSRIAAGVTRGQVLALRTGFAPP